MPRPLAVPGYRRAFTAKHCIGSCLNVASYVLAHTDTSFDFQRVVICFHLISEYVMDVGLQVFWPREHHFSKHAVENTLHHAIGIYAMWMTQESALTAWAWMQVWKAEVTTPFINAIMISKVNGWRMPPPAFQGVLLLLWLAYRILSPCVVLDALFATDAPEVNAVQRTATVVFVALNVFWLHKLLEHAGRFVANSVNAASSLLLVLPAVRYLRLGLQLPSAATAVVAVCGVAAHSSGTGTQAHTLAVVAWWLWRVAYGRADYSLPIDAAAVLALLTLAALHRSMNRGSGSPYVLALAHLVCQLHMMA